MSIGQIISLCVITGAFTLFAVVLAWGDYQTRHLASAAARRCRKPSRARDCWRSKTLKQSRPRLRIVRRRATRRQLASTSKPLPSGVAKWGSAAVALAVFYRQESGT
jgi:hypothetical protein